MCVGSVCTEPPYNDTNPPSVFLRCVVDGCNNEHSSGHLLPTSELLKTQRITFVFEGNALPPPPSTFLPLFTQIIRDPASQKKQK